MAEIWQARPGGITPGAVGISAQNVCLGQRMEYDCTLRQRRHGRLVAALPDDGTALAWGNPSPAKRPRCMGSGQRIRDESKAMIDIEEAVQRAIGAKPQMYNRKESCPEGERDIELRNLYVLASMAPD